MALPDTSKVVAELPPPLRPMLAPLVKTAFGFGVGTVVGAALFLATLILTLKGGEDTGALLGHLAHFMPGYDVNLAGSFVGLGWGFGYGFGCGWLLAAFRNGFVTVWVAVVGARERLRASENVLDDLM